MCRPVSAYALFFRDTQAAIKGQNPNASFGEVSKIVASMWDALDADSKNVSTATTSFLFASLKPELSLFTLRLSNPIQHGGPYPTLLRSAFQSKLTVLKKS